jgi:osmotically-inducible protein OsmY
MDVTVDDGPVTLTGKVGSAAERNQAYADAWTEGVELIDAPA